MSEIGKSIRLGKIVNQKSRKMVILAMDHAPVMGPVGGLADPVGIIQNVSKGKPDAVMLHKGNLKAAYNYFIEADIPFILKLTTTTLLGPRWNKTTLIDDVETAVRLGDDGVAVRTLLGSEHDPDMLRDFGVVANKCDQWGIPFFAMMYPDGTDNPLEFSSIKHVARLGAELGADVVKCYYTGSAETFKEVVECCPVPVVLSGGEKAKTPKDFLKTADGVCRAGAAGVMVGRNVFEHNNPGAMMQAIKAVVHDGKSIDDAAAGL